MSISGSPPKRTVAVCLAMLLFTPFARAGEGPVQQAIGSDQAQSACSQTPDKNAPLATCQPASEQPQSTVQAPVGTAAAPYEKPTGVTASKPAGAVIAPAKQKRARSILIRVSVVVGAAVAIGTVAALSHGSPSRPN